MDFIPISSPKHFPLSVKERAQLGLLRILGKAGVRLQMQDTIIVWACHYSLVKTPHNGGGDFCIRHKLPDREPFLNDLAKQAGTTVQRPHICNVVKKRGQRGQVITGCGALLERIQEPVCNQLGTG